MPRRNHQGAERGRKSRLGQERERFDEGPKARGETTQRVWKPPLPQKQSDQGDRGLRG